MNQLIKPKTKKVLPCELCDYPNGSKNKIMPCGQVKENCYCDSGCGGKTKKVKKENDYLKGFVEGFDFIYNELKTIGGAAGASVGSRIYQQVEIVNNIKKELTTQPQPIKEEIKKWKGLMGTDCIYGNPDCPICKPNTNSKEIEFEEIEEIEQSDNCGGLNYRDRCINSLIRNQKKIINSLTNRK